MRIKPAQVINQDDAPRSKTGSVSVYVRRDTIVLTKWPRKRGPCTQGYGFYRQQEWAWAGIFSVNAIGLEYQGAKQFSKGTQYVPRDVLMMAAMGTLYAPFTFEGVTYRSWRLENPNPQFILDLIGDTPGAILRRDPIGWVLLLPGDEGDVLAMTGGFPNWLPQGAPSLATFLVQTGFSELPNARVVQDSDSILADFSTPTEVYFRRAAITGDVEIASDDNTASIPDETINYAKIQNVSTTSRILGRKTAGTGVLEECTLSEILDFISSAAHGDILFRGDTTWARLPGGTAGQYLQTGGSSADPSWQPAVGGLAGQALLNPGSTISYRDANVYLTTPCNGQTTMVAGAVTNNVLYQFPLFNPFQRHFTSMAVKVSTGVASSKVRIGIYNVDSGNDRGPGALIVDGGDVTTTSTGVKTVSISADLAPGLYYLALIASATPQIFCIPASNQFANAGCFLDVSTNKTYAQIARSFTYGSLPSNEGSQTYVTGGSALASNQIPLIGIR